MNLWASWFSTQLSMSKDMRKVELTMIHSRRELSLVLQEAWPWRALITRQPLRTTLWIRMNRRCSSTTTSSLTSQIWSLDIMAKKFSWTWFLLPRLWEISKNQMARLSSAKRSSRNWTQAFKLLRSQSHLLLTTIFQTSKSKWKGIITSWTTFFLKLRAVANMW